MSGPLKPFLVLVGSVPADKNSFIAGEEKGTDPLVEVEGVDGGGTRLLIAVEAKHAPSERETPNFFVVANGAETILTVFVAISSKC